MANFLITSPNSLAQGTDTTDLFVLNTALGATVNGGGGGDTFTALAINGSNAVFAGGSGNDTIFFTAAGGASTLASMAIRAGNGSDVIAMEGAVTNSTLIGGGGNDSISLSGGTFTDSTINGNLGSDLISAVGGVYTRAFVAAGGFNDTINMSSQFVSATINGGGGADLLQLVGATTISGTLIQGDDPGDALYFANDTIQIGGVGLGTTTVLGGGGADVFQVSATLTTGNSFQGGTGADSIVLSSTSVVSAGLFIGMGNGNDTISVSALTNGFGTIQGGGGVDIVTVSGGAVNGGLIYGGEGADQIGLGTVSQGTWGTGAAVPVAGASGVAVAYSNFSQSNLAGFDVISADAAQATTGGNVFMVNQSAVTFSAVALGTFGVAGNQITVATGSRVTNFSNAGTVSLTARAAAIDASIGQGGTVIFQAGATNYLFVQGGAAGSGTDGDLVVQLNVLGFAALSGTPNGGVYGIDNSNVKIAFTDRNTF